MAIIEAEYIRFTSYEEIGEKIFIFLGSAVAGLDKHNRSQRVINSNFKGMNADESIQLTAREFDITVTGDTAQLRNTIIRRINELIEKDFQKLVNLLYRLDVSEEKLRKQLDQNPGKDAGEIITVLILERQEQKIKSRGQYSKRDDNIDEAEKW